MPTYEVRRASDDFVIGQYTAQRPSTAATKAFTTLRRKDKSLDKETFMVQTESRSTRIQFRVEYREVNDDFLGLKKRPIAIRIET
jgi:hypothetical protein